MMAQNVLTSCLVILGSPFRDVNETVEAVVAVLRFFENSSTIAVLGDEQPTSHGVSLKSVLELLEHLLFLWSSPSPKAADDTLWLKLQLCCIKAASRVCLTRFVVSGVEPCPQDVILSLTSLLHSSQEQALSAAHLCSYRSSITNILSTFSVALTKALLAVTSILSESSPSGMESVLPTHLAQKVVRLHALVVAFHDARRVLLVDVGEELFCGVHQDVIIKFLCAVERWLIVRQDQRPGIELNRMAEEITQVLLSLWSDLMAMRKERGAVIELLKQLNAHKQLARLIVIAEINGAPSGVTNYAMRILLSFIRQLVSPATSRLGRLEKDADIPCNGTNSILLFMLNVVGPKSFSDGCPQDVRLDWIRIISTVVTESCDGCKECRGGEMLAAALSLFRMTCSMLIEESRRVIASVEHLTSSSVSSETTADPTLLYELIDSKLSLIINAARRSEKASKEDICVVDAASEIHVACSWFVNVLACFETLSQSKIFSKHSRLWVLGYSVPELKRTVQDVRDASGATVRAMFELSSILSQNSCGDRCDVASPAIKVACRVILSTEDWSSECLRKSLIASLRVPLEVLVKSKDVSTRESLHTFAFMLLKMRNSVVIDT